MRRFLPILALLLSCWLVASARAESARTRAAFEHFYRYVETVGAGDLERAATFWRPQDVAAARRLGIAHPGGAMLKVDADSPIWEVQHTLLDTALADYQFGPAVDLASGPLAGNVTLVFRAYRGAERLTKQYFFQPDGEGGLLLASQARWVAEQGPGTPGRWVRVYERRPGRPWELPPRLLADLDAAVERMLDRLAVPARRRAVLAEQKLDYLLAHPQVVEYLAGAPTVGMADLQVDMVITHHPHHVHELAHLLVNVWLEQPPLYALPLLQEGLATHLAGRWGRDPRVLDRVGRQTLRDGLVTVDGLLGWSDFHSRSADLTYAPAGVFAGFLLDAYGPDATRAAYLAVSGNREQVQGWTPAEVKARLGGALGVAWDDLAARFAAHLAPAADPTPGLAPAAALARPDRPSPSSWQGQVLRTGPLTAQLKATPRGDLMVNVAGAGAPVRAALLCGGGDAEVGENDLFAEHFPGRPYRGETHALLLDEHEARLYDYRRQTLTALHSEGFWPTAGGDRPYARDAGRWLSVVLDASVAPPDAGWALIPREP